MHRGRRLSKSLGTVQLGIDLESLVIPWENLNGIGKRPKFPDPFRKRKPYFGINGNRQSLPKRKHKKQPNQNALLTKLSNLVSSSRVDEAWPFRSKGTSQMIGV